MRATKQLLLIPILLLLAGTALATPCVLPDNGSGSVDFPPPCPGGYEGYLRIIDGLPPGSTIEGLAVLSDFYNVVRTPGGTLGGEVQQFDATLYWTAAGTGDFAGFNRNLAIPVLCEVHTGPRNPGDPVQEFDQTMYSLQGELFGDPDFCTLRVRAGAAFGLPSPGDNTLTRLPSGDFNVDSFFDITYQIEFEGCPGSQLEDMAGTTTATDPYEAGEHYTPPNPDLSCILPNNGTGTVDLPPECPDGYEGQLRVIDGLPPGSTIEGPAVLTDFYNTFRTPGGTLGGEVQQFDATLYWTASGTGDFAGLNRNLAIPVVCEVHTGPRNPGDPVQSFAQDMYFLSGELFGDPDFCTLRVRSGIGAGLPSPGQTTLTELPSGDFNVDSFFDITYQIEFEGCPDSPLADLAGTTTDTQRFQAGEPYYPYHSCVLPDNGTGTVDLPPECPDGYEGQLRVIDGLPPGSTIEGPAVLTDFYNTFRTPGGTLGGEVQQFDATLYWTASGTGDFAGFNRNLAIPVVCEVHTGPRNPGDPVQSFAQDMYFLSGELFGDPDFCTLRVRSGIGAGLPSPGHTTLTRVPTGDFAVDSFFDITYQIEFEGCPGGQLEDLAGTTTATDRYQAGEEYLTGVSGGAPPVPYILHQNVPNPFNPSTTISYVVPANGGRVELDIFDLSGRLVRSLVNERQSAGEKSVVWNGMNDSGEPTASGVYLYVLSAGPQKLVRKMAVIK